MCVRCLVLSFSSGGDEAAESEHGQCGRGGDDVLDIERRACEEGRVDSVVVVVPSFVDGEVEHGVVVEEEVAVADDADDAIGGE